MTPLCVTPAAAGKPAGGLLYQVLGEQGAERSLTFVP